jgi:uncharacterized protein (TIGR02391 family)
VSSTDPFEQLIQRGRELDKFAQSIQSEYPSPILDHELRVFRDQYQSWYFSGRALLPDDLRDRFARSYVGAKFVASIKGFLDNSTNKALFRRSHTILKCPTSTKNWQSPYGIWFKKPFEEQSDILREAQGRPSNAIDITKLHPRICAASAKLFDNGHYRNAIFEASLALNQLVKHKSASSAPDGTNLMQQVFSPKNPLLVVSESEDERTGVMWLFVGSWMGLRNPRGHQINADVDMTGTECLEWLAFLSALMRIVDRSERFASPSGRG